MSAHASINGRLLSSPSEIQRIDEAAYNPAVAMVGIRAIGPETPEQPSLMTPANRVASRK
jgi:hypothetical protein